MTGLGFIDSALARARVVLAGPGGTSNAGPGVAQNSTGAVTDLAKDRRPDVAYAGSPNVWPLKPPPAFCGQRGSAPNVGSDKLMAFIPPLALFNDASQWVDRKYFVRPMTWLQNPDSNPPIRAQYFTPPPVNVSNLAAGQINLQLQLGAVDIQAMRLTEAASTYYGG